LNETDETYKARRDTVMELINQGALIEPGDSNSPDRAEPIVPSVGQRPGYTGRLARQYGPIARLNGNRSGPDCSGAGSARRDLGFKEQIITTDVAANGDEGPGDLLSPVFETRFDLGGFAVGDGLDHVAVGAVLVP
jgi:hypothetical protein